MTTVRYIQGPLYGTYSDHCAVHIVTTVRYILLPLGYKSLTLAQQRYILAQKRALIATEHDVWAPQPVYILLTKRIPPFQKSNPRYPSSNARSLVTTKTELSRTLQLLAGRRLKKNTETDLTAVRRTF